MFERLNDLTARLEILKADNAALQADITALRVENTAAENPVLGAQSAGLRKDNAERRAKLDKLTRAADALRDRFGFGKVQFGGSLKKEEQ